MKLLIDIPFESYYTFKCDLGKGNLNALAEIIANGKPYIEKTQGKCRTCEHRDPENKKCDCGAPERAGCPFPVRDNYFCKFYEKRGRA